MTFKFKKGGSGVRNLKEGMNQGIEVLLSPCSWFSGTQWGWMGNMKEGLLL